MTSSPSNFKLNALPNKDMALIGIGGNLSIPPLPHHHAYGSVRGGSTNLSC